MEGFWKTDVGRASRDEGVESSDGVAGKTSKAKIITQDVGESMPEKEKSTDEVFAFKHGGAALDQSGVESSPFKPYPGRSLEAALD